MNTDTVTTFFALILLGSLVGFGVAASRPSGRESLRENALTLAAIVAVGATLGSLYMSEVADFVPCEMCWFQRIAMYPLAVILPIAAIRKHRSVLDYGLVLASIGLVISTYHTQLQMFPEQGSSCSLSAPCTAKWVEALGWMTLPQMAWICFALIAGLSLIARYSTPQEIL